MTSTPASPVEDRTAPIPPPSGSGARFSLVRFIPQRNELISLTVLILVVIIFTITTEGLLISPATLNVLATFGPEILILTMAVGIVLVTGQIDLSVGSIYVVSSVVLAASVRDLGAPLWLACLIAIASGGIMGLVNGLLVVKTGVSSFIVTLGTMWAFRGLMLVFIGSTTISVFDDPESFTAFDLLAGRTFGVSHQVLWLLILVVVLALVFTKSRFGVWIRAVGSNERSARMMGIPTRKVTVKVFVLSGLLSGFAGVIQVAQSNQAVPQSGDSVMLTALAGAIIGGVALTGGRGGVIGPLLGGLTLLVISLGFVMMGVVEFWTNILVAVAVIFTAYAFTRLENLRVRKARKS
jgi:ribose/xylose/arabinose/galactoside ABC-type transport system permease subunit